MGTIYAGYVSMPAVTTAFPPIALSNLIDIGVYLTNLSPSGISFLQATNIRAKQNINNKRFIILLIRCYIVNNFYILIIHKI